MVHLNVSLANETIGIGSAARGQEVIHLPRRRSLRMATVTIVVALIAGCSTLPFANPNTPRVQSSAFDRPASTHAGRALLSLVSPAHSGDSAFRLMPVGADGFVTRIEMADAAEHTLDLQYFIYRSDHSGRAITEALLRAADRGVRVRILVDDGETAPGDEQILLLDAHPNIEVRVFNPFVYRGHDKLIRGIEFSLSADRLDYRMHNKLFVVDNAMALVGGRNVADEYFQIDPKRQFADDDMFAGGQVVQELSRKFDAYWNNDLAVQVAALSTGKPSPSQLDDYRRSLMEHHEDRMPDGQDYSTRIASGQPLEDMVTGRLPLTWARSTVVCDSPDKKKVEEGWRVGQLMERPVANAASAVQSELLMVTPYLIPGHEGMQLFETLRARGVTIKLLTNSMETETVAAAQGGYMHYRRALLGSGVDLYEIRAKLGDARGSGQTEAISRYGNYSLHGKMFVFDRNKIFIGSMNFDQRSMHLNTEIGLIIESDTMARQIVDRFDAMVRPENAYRLGLESRDSGRLTWDTVTNGQRQHLSREPARSLWQRIQVDALSLLPLDKEL